MFTLFWVYVPILGPSWDYVGFCWVVLGLCWPILGLCWACLGSNVGPSWLCVGLSWGYVAPSWGHVEGRKDLKVQKLYENMFTSQFFTVFVQHSCSHYNAFGSITSQTCTYLRTWQHQMTTIMQPFQCDLQTADSTTPYNYACTSTPKAACSHHYNAAKKKANRPQPQPPHTGGTCHRRLQPLYTEKHGKTQGFVLRLPPQHKPHATFMQPLQCILQYSLHHHFPSSPFPFLTTSLRHHPVS